MQGLMGLMSMPTGPGIGPMFSVISGQQQQQAYNTEAGELSQEAAYSIESSQLAAAQNNYQVAKTMGTQEAQFGAAGVTMAGSPLGILTETQQLGGQVSNAILLQGQLQSALQSEQGLQMLRQGSAAAFAGQANAMQDNYNYQLQKAQTVDAAIGGLGQAGMNAAMGLAFGRMGMLGQGMGLGGGLFGGGGNSIAGFQLPPVGAINPAIGTP